jgi:hypothetical protein
MGLGEELIRAGLITPEQLDEGARARVLYGGRLGTNLVELGHVDLDSLTQLLAEHHGLPAALARHFESADPVLQASVPAVLAVAHNAVPLSVVSPLPRLIAVAFMDPPSTATLAELGRAVAGEVVPAIAPELRVRYQLERVYGHPRTPRYLRVRRPTDPQGRELKGPAGVERRRYVKTLSDVEPEGTLGRIELERRALPSPAAPGEAAQIDCAVSVDDAIRGMRRATDRDRVVELAISCLRDGFDRALGAGLFLLVRDETAIGWRGFATGADEDIIRQIAIPLELPSVLQLAYRTGVMACGRPPAAGGQLDGRLWALLGAEAAPAECVVAPVHVQNRTVCLLYAHPRNLRAIAEPVSDAVAALAEAAGHAFLRLIRAANR